MTDRPTNVPHDNYISKNMIIFVMYVNIICEKVLYIVSFQKITSMYMKEYASDQSRILVADLS